MKNIAVIIFCFGIFSACKNENTSITQDLIATKEHPLTIQYLIDSLGLKPTFIKNNDKELIAFHPNRNNGLHLDFHYRKLSDGLWALTDSLTNSPYYIIEVKAGKRNGFYALAAEERSFLLTDIGEYSNDKENGEFISYDFRGLLKSKSKYLDGAMIDSQFLYDASGSIYLIRIYGKERLDKIIEYDTSGNVVSEQFQYSDSILIYKYNNGKLIWLKKNIYSPKQYSIVAIFDSVMNIVRNDTSIGK